jgi:hypothetical protein
MAERRLIVGERTATGQLDLGQSRTVELGEAVSIGRDAEVIVAMDPPDNRVSRRAATVTAGPGGWNVAVSNRNGLLVHPWGLPAWQARPAELLTENRVALRILGTHDREHWVLLESDELVGFDTAGVRTIGQSASTIRATAVRPLTPAQLEAVVLLFAELLAWPPRASAAPGQLKQVARALGVSVSAVQERLKAVVAKAVTLGLSREVEVTDPEYVYVLVRAGYLGPDHLGGTP